VSDAYEHNASNASTHYAENAEKLIADTCRPLAAANQRKCIDQAEQSARENQRVEQDLAAQKVTAWWTKIMGVAALIGMALSAVGVFLVYTTFHETRQANLLSKAQQRGRIAVNFVSGIGNETGSLVIAMKARNIGHSVVINCRASVHDSAEIPKRLSPVFTEGAIYTLASQAEATLATYSRPDFLANGYYLFGIVKYDCIFGDPH
jgi:hypothetical protein